MKNHCAKPVCIHLYATVGKTLYACQSPGHKCDGQLLFSGHEPLLSNALGEFIKTRPSLLLGDKT